MASFGDRNVGALPTENQIIQEKKKETWCKQQHGTSISMSLKMKVAICCVDQSLSQAGHV